MIKLRRHFEMAFMIAVLIWPLTPQYAFAQSATADQLKAVYLLNFAKFIEWPAESLPAGDSPLTFCTLGLSAVVDELEPVLRGKSINGHVTRLRRLQGPDSISGCHLVFLAAGAGKHRQKLLQAAHGQPILLVGEVPGFARAGGTVSFLIEDGKVLFEVNVDAAGSSRLKISAKLLALARIVNSEQAKQGP